MANLNAYIQTFAGGEFGDAMSARVDIESYQAACELSENWWPRAQGPMFRRPPLQYIDSFENSALKGILKRFEFDVGQNYMLIVVENKISFYLNDGALDFPTVTASISNGNFSNFTGWTDNSETGSSAGATGGQMFLTSNGAGAARARTTFTVNEDDTVHVLRFMVSNGPVDLRIGTAAGTGGLATATGLARGLHQIEFLPTSTGTHHIEISHAANASTKTVDDLAIVTAESLYTISSPWTEEDLRGVSTAQDGDRLYMFHRDYAPRVLERRGHRSWSMIYFEPDDGPLEFGDPTIQMTPSVRSGNGTMTSEVNYFSADDVRRLLRVTHSGQFIEATVIDDSVYTDAIKVAGIGIDRIFDVTITGTFSGTITLQRSVTNQNDFSDVITFTAASSETYNDSYSASQDSGNKAGSSDAVYDVTSEDDAANYGRLDNTTVYYRLVVKPGDWTSGSATLQISTEGGSQSGIARITEFTNATTVSIEVLEPFSQAGASDIWDISPWSAEFEYPDIVAFANGRLWTARRRQLWASVPDDYFSFEQGTEADNAIAITLRSKSAEGVRWMRELDFLCLGTRNEEYVIRSTSPNEPIGPSTTEPSLQGEEGAATIEAEVGGESILYVHRNGRRVMQFTHNSRALSPDSFISVDLTRLNPDICEDGIINMVVQQEPERRIFVVLKNGLVKTALFRREEEIVCWTTMRTDGVIEDVAVLRESDEDAVYFIVRRNIDGTFVRMLERMRSEVILNDEDLVHLDSMLETDISRPDGAITPSSISIGAVTVTSPDDVFSMSDEGNVLWVDGGRITIDTYNSATSITGTIVYPLLGKTNSMTGAREARAIAPGRWGIATAVTSVTGLDHLEGMTVQIWADLTYQGTAVVSSGEVALPSGVSASRIFVGLSFESLWVSLKLAYGGQKGTAVTQKKRVNTMGLLISRSADTLFMGDKFGKLEPLVKQSAPSFIGNSPRLYTGEAHVPFNGRFEDDPRIIIATGNCGPATIKALIPNIQTNER